MIAENLGSNVGDAANSMAAGTASYGDAARIDPEAEDAYWRVNHVREPYYDARYNYDDYAPAYRVGYMGRSRYIDRFAEAEIVLSRDWEEARGSSRLSWHEARQASLAAWIRVDNAVSNPEGTMPVYEGNS